MCCPQAVAVLAPVQLRALLSISQAVPQRDWTAGDGLESLV